jgi:Transposase family tnp2
MPLLISGPKQLDNDIDVFLAPLLEELHKLWRDDVRIYDANLKEQFILRVMIFCTINDFPAYGNLSGCRTKGFQTCPICGDDTCSLRLKNCKKNIYMGHHRFLRLNHSYRKKKNAFDGTVKLWRAPMPLTGKKVSAKVKDIKVQFGKKFKDNLEGIWRKRFIFWDLPYWSHLDVRHCLDLMHIIKNIGESLVGSLLNIQGKTKDSIKVRENMIEMGICPELAPQDGEKWVYLTTTCYTLSRKEKINLLECLKLIKVSFGYSSNISKKVSTKESKLIGMKSHDFYIMLTQLLPIAIREPGVAIIENLLLRVLPLSRTRQL